MTTASWPCRWRFSGLTILTHRPGTLATRNSKTTSLSVAADSGSTMTMRSLSPSSMASQDWLQFRALASACADGAWYKWGQGIIISLERGYSYISGYHTKMNMHNVSQVLQRDSSMQGLLKCLASSLVTSLLAYRKLLSTRNINAWCLHG